MEGSEFGINEGRISKLSIRKGNEEIYHYDRFLDFDYIEDEESKEVYEEILRLYN